MNSVENWLGADNKLGVDIWTNKYQYKGETFEEWLNRVSGGNEKVKQLILDKKILHAGRILSNRGLQYSGKKITYSNCYVIGHPEDSIESIFECCSKLARTYSYGGGCGIDISYLAPNGAKVNNAAEESTGAVSFMDLFSMVTEIIAQRGRRGALMICMDVSHPDILEFINCKSDLERVTKANISVKLSKEFLDAVEQDKDWEVSFKRPEVDEVYSQSIPAGVIFRELCENAWNTADPGILYWDNISNYNILDHDDTFSYDGTNPCAEEPLPAGGSCLLSSINLSQFVEDPFEPSAAFNLPLFKETVANQVIELNTLLDEGLSLHPLQEQKDSVRDWRQIGIGIMGLADTFIKLGIRYGSERSLSLIHQIGNAMANSALQQSALLAKEYGAFPKCNIDNILKSNYINSVANPTTKVMIEKWGLRNSQLLTIAPTGSLSTMLGISGGIEPLFATSFTRRTQSIHKEGDVVYECFAPIISQLTGMDEVVEGLTLPDYVVTAHDLHWKERIKVQAAFQKYIDASISSTVNLPQEASVDTVANIYLEAHKAGCKGITVYRENCARQGILVTKKNKEELEKEAEQITFNEVCEAANKVTNVMGELFTQAQTALSNIFENLKNSNDVQKDILNISQNLKNNTNEPSAQDFIDIGLCPECKSILVRTEGCMSCQSCGWGKCSL